MKRCLGFFLGSLFGAVVVSLAFWCSWARLQAERNESEFQSADRVLQDRYVARVLDFAHLALMLRGIEPSLERDWIEESLVVHARELSKDFRQSRIAGHAMKMITGYYTKNNLPIPPELEEIWRSLAEDPALMLTHSNFSIVAAFNERLAEYDAYMVTRRAWEDSHSEQNSPTENNIRAQPVRPNDFSKNWGSAVSF
jgi:hypothetical protein